MIRRDNNVFVGKVARPHGTRGQLLIRLRNINPDEIKKCDWLFVSIDGLLVPFFMNEFRRGTSDSVLAKLEYVNSEEDARTLSGCEVYVNPACVKRSRKKVDSVSISGYRVTDKKLGYIGDAVEITNYSLNPLLKIRNGEKEFLIPAHEDIMEISHKGKEIIIDGPEGLMDL